MRSGRLAPGVRLPSSRTLAVDLGIARNTVADAYGQLIAEGWLVARQGSGTRVADLRRFQDAPVPPAEKVAKPRYDLRPGSPDSAAFPRGLWLSAARRALNRAPAEAFGYSDPRGRPELRGALAEYLARARGVNGDAERIVICAGFTQGLGVLCRALEEHRVRTVALEEYGIQEHRRIVAQSGLRALSVPVDDMGARPDGLRDAEAVLLTPAHQFPLGVTLAPDRRAEIVDWAGRDGRVVIEDDYDGEFRYDRQPVGAMQALAPDRVIYAGTASKSLAPGVRLGWLVVPSWLVRTVSDAQALAVRGLSTIDQLTLAELIRSGAYDRHIRRERLKYRRRRDQLVAALASSAPQARITGIAAGLHGLLIPPPDCDEASLVARAAGRGLTVQGLATYAATPNPEHTGLVIGYGCPPDHAYTATVARLTATLSES
jgi:GntR family transcriptional regulator/MocR family aminotransferase